MLFHYHITKGSIKSGLRELLVNAFNPLIFKSVQFKTLENLTVCSYHVTYPFQSKSSLYSGLNVKERLAWSRRKIWSLSDCNWTRTHNDLVRTWTLSQTKEYSQHI